MVYKISEWWQHLGLILLGFFFNYSFNMSVFYFLFLGFSLLSFAHAFDDNKKTSIFFFFLIIFLLFYGFFVQSYVIFFQIVLIIIILILCSLYTFKINCMPISAFYKGFGYSLLFFLPFKNLNFSAVLFYVLLSCIALMSEITHEAAHFEEDKKEKKFTTAIFFNIKINKNRRYYFKTIFIIIGLILLLYLILR